MVYIYGILATIGFCLCGSDSDNLKILIIVNIGAAITTIIFGYLFTKEIEKNEKKKGKY